MSEILTKDTIPGVFKICLIHENALVSGWLKGRPDTNNNDNY